MALRLTFHASALVTLVGAGALSWSTDRTSDAYVVLAADVARPEKSPIDVVDLVSNDAAYRVVAAGPLEYPYRFTAEPAAGLVFETGGGVRTAPVIGKQDLALGLPVS